MNAEAFRDVLKRHMPGDVPERIDAAACLLHQMAEQIAMVLEGIEDTPARQELLALVSAQVLAKLGDKERLRPTPPTPEILEWARNHCSEEDILAGIREIQATGGLELKDFIHELEQEVRSHG